YFLYFRLEDVEHVNPIQLKVVDIAISHMTYSGGDFSIEYYLTFDRSRQYHCITRGTGYFKSNICHALVDVDSDCNLPCGRHRPLDAIFANSSQTITDKNRYFLNAIAHRR
ncbi:hypothetical protein ACTXT7_016431, partial [Hymenolepis weldensis]